MKLTPKQKMFCDLYVESLNATQSYLKAYGIKSNRAAASSGYKLLRNADIQIYIEEIMKKKSNERIASADEVLSFLTSVQRGEVTEQVPLVLGKDFKVIDKEPSIRDRTKAAELIGKRYALFTEKHDISGDVGLHINVDYGDEIEDS